MIDSGHFHAKPCHVADAYGIAYKEADRLERRMVWYLTMVRATLEVIADGSGLALSNLLGEKKMTPEEAAFTKVLTMARLDVPAFRQVYRGHPYKTQVTIQAIAACGELYGVLVHIFDSNSCQFSDSLLLLPSHSLLNVALDTPKTGAAAYKKLVSVDEYRHHFKLLDLLEAGGFDTLLSVLLGDANSSVPSLVRPTLPAGLGVRVAPLERFVSLPTLMADYYSN